MSTDPQRRPPRTGEQLQVSEYFQLDSAFPMSKYEYQNGVVRMMSGGSREHDAISHNIYAAFKQNFLTGPCFVSGSDMRVQLSKATYVYPDGTVSCDVADRRRGNKLIRSPRIVVEVLSPSTEKYDRSEKLTAYQNCPTIQEVMLVSQFAPHVDIYRRNSPESTTWTAVIYDPGQEILLESIDVSMTFEEIYQGIDFDEPLLEE